MSTKQGLQPLLTTLLVSSLVAACLNLGLGVLDRPRAFDDPMALFLPLAVGVGVFALGQGLVLAVLRLVDRRWSWTARSHATAVGVAAALFGVSAPLAQVLTRGAGAGTSNVPWMLAGGFTLCGALAGFLMAERLRGSERASAWAVASPLIAVELLGGLWLSEYVFAGESLPFRVALMAGLALVAAGTGWLVSRPFLRLPALPVGLVLLTLILTGPFLPSAARGGPGPTAMVPKELPPAVVLITVDTLRPDMILGSASGAPTPALEGLMKDSVVFENARAAAPWTKPSLASILTGLSPQVHGTTNRRARLPDRVETLAERLASAGYATTGMGLNVHLEELFHFGQGFQDYRFPARPDWGISVGAQVLERIDRHRFPELFPTTEAIADVTVDWLDRNHDKPFFLWMHLLDPHWPYEPPKEWFDGEEHPRFGRRWGDPDTVTDVQAGNTKLGADDQEYVRDLYRGEVRYADQNVGRVLDKLREHGLYDEALIVFASDHGEEFWEHGSFEHGHTMYDEVLRVPLSFKLPHSTSTARVNADVSTESLTPTLLEIVGLKVDPGDFSTRSLVPWWKDRKNAHETPHFASATYYRGEKRAVIEGKWKLVLDVPTGILELYDLEQDPRELHSLTSSQPAVVARLLELHTSWVVSCEALRERLGIEAAQGDLDATLESKLQALGYGGDAKG